MRKTLLSIALFACFCSTPQAAQAPTYSESRQYLYAIGTNPIRNPATGAVTAVSWGGVYYGHFVNTADPTDTFERQDGSVSWDGFSSSKSVTIGNVTLTYAQIFAYNEAMADQEWKASAAAAAAAAAKAKLTP